MKWLAEVERKVLTQNRYKTVATVMTCRQKRQSSKTLVTQNICKETVALT
jgi:hypothetical protein